MYSPRRPCLWSFIEMDAEFPPTGGRKLGINKIQTPGWSLLTAGGKIAACSARERAMPRRSPATVRADLRAQGLGIVAWCPVDPPGEHLTVWHAVQARLPNPRDPRGIRHTLTSLLLAAVAAVLAGAQSFTEISECTCRNDAYAVRLRAEAISVSEH
jgi:hypothetical protein